MVGLVIAAILSWSLAIGMTIVFLGFLALVDLSNQLFGEYLLLTGGVVFVLSWVMLFWAHKIEGKKPSFLTDLLFLVVGPLWTLDKFYKTLRIKS